MLRNEGISWGRATRKEVVAKINHLLIVHYYWQYIVCWIQYTAIQQGVYKEIDACLLHPIFLVEVDQFELEGLHSSWQTSLSLTQLPHQGRLVRGRLIKTNWDAFFFNFEKYTLTAYKSNNFDLF